MGICVDAISRPLTKELIVDKVRETLLVSCSSPHRTRQVPRSLVGLQAVSRANRVLSSLRYLAATIPLAVTIACQEFPAVAQDVVARAERARALSTGPFESKPFLDGLADTDPLVRGTCVLSLVQHEPRFVNQFFEQYPAVAGKRVRAFIALEQLAADPDDSQSRLAAAVVCNEVTSIDEPLLRSRAAAACWVEGLLPEASLEPLSEDAHWAVRARLARALNTRTDVHLSSSTVSNILRRLSEDPHPTVRRAARGDVNTPA